MDNNVNPQMNQGVQTQIPQGPTKNCKHCKSIIPKGAKVCPICHKKQGGIGKWVVIAIIAIIILASIGGGGNDDNTTSSDDTSPKSENTADTKPANDNDSSDTDGSSDDSDSKDAELKFSVGDTWENKYMKVTYVECGEYTDYSEYFQPADGNKIIYATFEFENVSDSDRVAMYTDFNCYADGYSCDGYYYADDSGFSQTLSSGRKCTGTVYFEVPENSTEIEFEYDVNFWTSENIVFMYSN